MPTLEATGDEEGVDELERLWDELAGIARETAALLIQPDHSSADVDALDARADALRARIKAIQAQRRPSEPVEFWRGCRYPVSVAVSVPTARCSGVGGRMCGLHAHTW
jgi:hypothetical protein